jgi:hypothetical protein
MDCRTLALPAWLFVQFVIGATPGDCRNWTAIRTWTAAINPLLLAQEPPDRPGAPNLEAVVA